MRIPLPRRDNRAIVPAALSALLLALLVAQFALPASARLADSWSPPPRRLARREVGQVGVAPIIAARALFTPTRRSDRFSAGTGSNGAEAATADLGGTTVAGAIAVRGVPRAILRTPTGSIVRLPIGGSYRGWVLAAVTRDAAIFRRATERLAMPFGAAPPAAGNEQSAQVEEQ